MSDKNVVLVAGYDYKGGVSFSQLCLNRMERLLKTEPDLIVTLFDVAAGVVKISEVDAKGKRAWRDLSTFKKVSKANYNEKHHFVKDQAGVMSVTDVYDYVLGLGTSAPGSLVEMSFFGHGWQGGPILVNSFDGQPNDPARDPNDKDPRVWKDFEPPQMLSADRDHFHRAFHPDGFVWVWGCAFTEIYRQVLHQSLKQLKKYGGKPADKDAFQFTFAKEWADKYYPTETLFFPGKDNAGKYPLTFDRSFFEVKSFFWLGAENTYARVAATTAGVPCYSALLGTYSTYETGVKLPLMLIPTKVPPYGDNFTNYISFYTTHLGATTDPESRGYGVYPP